MNTHILFFHSILRYFILLFMILVLIQSITGIFSKRPFAKNDKLGALILMILCDLQLLGGLVIYMMNGWMGKMGQAGAMKDHATRFFGMEHPLMMAIAIVLVHVGYARAKKNIPDEKKFRTLFWCAIIALFLVMARIPWPGMKDVGRPFIPAMIQTL
jgi:heme A synthase